MRPHKKSSVRSIGTVPRAGAVLYLRVSTGEQAEGPLNLKNQEAVCRTFAAQNGLSIATLFVDPGESARTADRPEFQRMLEYCRKHRREVGFVIVQDLSRFARSLRDQMNAVEELEEHDIVLRSVWEPNIGTDAAGKMMAQMTGVFNEHFSNTLSEKMRVRSKAAAMAGRWPWPAPIGFITDSRQKAGPNLFPDPKRASLVGKAFELYATGRYTKKEVLNIITKKGLRTRRGLPMSVQTFGMMLRKPVYCGLISGTALEHPARGLHQPIISRDLFETVQRVLAGKKLNIAPEKSTLNPAFPLKNFVRCTACGTKLTGGFGRGKSGKLFGYYWCRNPRCKKTRVPKRKLDEKFVQLLESHRPDAALASEFLSISEGIYKRHRVEATVNARGLSEKLEGLKAMKSELLRSKLRGEIALADYTAENIRLTSDISEIEADLAASKSTAESLEAFKKFSAVMFSNLAEAWQHANIEQQVRVETLLFNDTLYYEQESGCFNSTNSSFFNMMGAFSMGKSSLASPTGFEPVLPP